MALLLLLVKATPTSLVPDEDTGMLYVNLTTKPGMTLNETDRALQQLDKKLATPPASPTVLRSAAIRLLRRVAIRECSTCR